MSVIYDVALVIKGQDENKANKRDVNKTNDAMEQAHVCENKEQEQK